MVNLLSLSPYIQEIHRGDKYIYINPNIPSWIITNQLGKVVLSLFNGKLSKEEIISIAVEGIGESKREVIENFCERIIKSRILENIPPTPKSHRLKLSSVHLSLGCLYCYARERKEKRHPKLTFLEYTKLIDDILRISTDLVFTLTGGEPLLNKDCFNIAEYLKSKKQKIFLLTNGVLISEQNISIHSKTRGQGNYAKVTKTVELLRKNNINYSISMTVTKQNIDYVEDMARMYGNKLNFAPYFPVSGETSVLAISGTEYYQALKKASGVRPLGYCERSLDASQISQCHKCAIGDGEFSISATGDVYPCQLLHTDEFYAGNVHEKSIVDI